MAAEKKGGGVQCWHFVGVIITPPRSGATALEEDASQRPCGLKIMASVDARDLLKMRA